MFDRRRGRRFSVRSRAEGSLRVVRDVCLLRDGAAWSALSGESIARGEPLTLAAQSAGHRRLYRVIVHDVRTLIDGPDMRYELSLQPASRGGRAARKER